MQKMFVLLGVFLFSGILFAQRSYENMEPVELPKHAIYVKPFDFIGGGISLGYQNVHEKYTLKGEAGYFFSADPFFYEEGENMEGYRTELVYKRTIKIIENDHYLLVPYLAGYGLFKSISLEDIPGEDVPNFFPPLPESFPRNAEAQAYGFGVYFGVDVFYKQGLTLDLFLVEDSTIQFQKKMLMMCI